MCNLIHVFSFYGKDEKPNTLTEQSMKKSIFIFLLFAGLLSLTSCEIKEKGVEMRTDHFEVFQRSWEWNSVYQRYEFIFDYWEIDEYMYYDGALTAGVYITETNDEGQRYEVLRSLPFVHTYVDGATTFTETIGYDVSPGDNRYPGKIAFYIQASDLSNTKKFLRDYTFKVTTFWRE